VTAAARPEWVDAVNRGDIWPMTEAASAPFALSRLAAEAGIDTPVHDTATAALGVRR